MNEPIWVNADALLAYHAHSAGRDLLVDRNLLLSALGAPQFRFKYNRKISMADLAARYAFGVVKNHAFKDGNKRAAWLSVRLFFKVNGIAFKPRQKDAVQNVVRLAEGDMTERMFADWLACEVARP